MFLVRTGGTTHIQY